MKKQSELLFFAVWMCMSVAAFAQPGGKLGQLELSVTDKYKAKVGEAVKYTDMPQFEDTTTLKLPVNYRISSQPIEVKYVPEPISHARVAKVPVDELYQGMVKAGFGLYGTPMVEAYWNSGRNTKRSYGFWGNHFSSHSGVKQTIYDNNGWSNNTLGGYYTGFYKDLSWNTKLFGRWDKYSYYGIDQYPEAFGDSLDDLKKPEPDFNWFRQYEISSSIKGKKDNDLGMLDKLEVRYYNFSDRYASVENFGQLNSDWKLPAGNIDLDLGVNVQYFKTSFDSILDASQEYFTAQLHPSVSISAADVIFDFGINLYANNYTSSLPEDGEFTLPFFPEVNVEYPFVEDVLSIYGGVKGQQQHNTYRRLTNENPYVMPLVALRPTRTTDFYVGLEGILSSTTSFNVKGGMLNQNDLALYYRNPYYRWDTTMNALNVLYDNSQTFYAHGELGVNVNNNLQLGLMGELRAYNTNIQTEAWHRPKFVAGVNADYTIREKIKLGAEANYTGKRYVFDEGINPELENTLPAYLLANLEVEYLYNSRLTAFVNVRNLTNSKYDLFLGYKAQSINFLMGFSYKL